MPNVWQPIETAPKDGVAFLVWCPGNLCTYQVIRHKAPRADLAFYIWTCHTNQRLSEHNQPTHWQPLPDPPSMKDEANG